jgi:cyclopropane fatty-acyl-phospholipid synthase-like methyltransferase
MNQANFDEARKAEANYHKELYEDNEILEPGTWMSKPIPLVMELLDRLLQQNTHVNVLDLGCGAGRNTIPIAIALKETRSKVIGLDLLDEAVAKLRENAEEYGVADIIEAEKSDAENAEITVDYYDYIIACGCLEHVSSEEAMIEVIERMQRGTKIGGIHCIEMNTNVQEIERDTGRELRTLIELNLPTERAFAILEKVYKGWNVLEHKTKLQSIDEEKYDKPSQFRCQSITFAVQKTDK